MMVSVLHYIQKLFFYSVFALSRVYDIKGDISKIARYRVMS